MQPGIAWALFGIAIMLLNGSWVNLARLNALLGCSAISQLRLWVKWQTWWKACCLPCFRRLQWCTAKLDSQVPHLTQKFVKRKAGQNKSESIHPNQSVMTFKRLVVILMVSRAGITVLRHLGQQRANLGGQDVVHRLLCSDPRDLHLRI